MLMTVPARTYHRILRVARTIADIAGTDRGLTTLFMEAINTAARSAKRADAAVDAANYPTTSGTPSALRREAS